MLNTTGLFRFNLYYYSVLLLLLFAFVLAFQRGEEVYFINDLHTAGLDIYFSSITHLGNALFYLPLLVVSLFIRFQYVAMLATTGLAHSIMVTVFKRLLFPSAPRPIQVLNVDQLYLVPGVEVHKIMSFPSGHTATAFAFLVLLSLMLKSRLVTIVLSGIAVSVALSRIYLLQHFGMDIVIGGLIGSATAFITYYFYEFSPKPYWMLSRLRINRYWVKRNLVGLRQIFNL